MWYDYQCSDILFNSNSDIELFTDEQKKYYLKHGHFKNDVVLPDNIDLDNPYIVENLKQWLV